ncbi:MAG: hypothetical protein FJX61_05200 [Alphaproteobacteria bacterium]|nr:hypothetical protein [Alphaproteobacteria bacterium]
MTVDLWTAAAAVVLALVQLGLASGFAKRVTGRAWSVGPRDHPIELTGLAGRLDRAFRNLMETFPLFVALVVIAHVAGKANVWTAVGAQVYFWSRVLYVPAYASGVPRLRTAIWQIGMIGLVVIMVQLFR